ELVVGRTAGVHAGQHAERSALGQHALAPANGVFVKRGNGKVPIDVSEIFQSQCVKAMFADGHSCLMHVLVSCVPTPIMRRDGCNNLRQQARAHLTKAPPWRATIDLLAKRDESVEVPSKPA